MKNTKQYSSSKLGHWVAAIISRKDNKTNEGLSGKKTRKTVESVQMMKFSSQKPLLVKLFLGLL